VSAKKMVSRITHGNLLYLQIKVSSLEVF